MDSGSRTIAGACLLLVGASGVVGQRFLRRQDHRDDRRQRRRRRLRHLHADDRAPSRPPHSRATRRSWSRTCRGRAAAGPRRISIRSRPRTGPTLAAVFPGVARLAAARRSPGRDVRSDQVHLLGHRRQRHARVRDLPELEDHDLTTMRLRTRPAWDRAGSAPRPATTSLFKKKTTGAQFELVMGYKGSADILLAMERGEIDGICGWDWSSVKSQRPDWLRDGKLNLLVQVALEPEPELTRLGVPPLWNFIKNEDDRKAVELIVSQQMFQRPYLAAARACRQSRSRTCAARSMRPWRDGQFLDDAREDAHRHQPAVRRHACRTWCEDLRRRRRAWSSARRRF